MRLGVLITSLASGAITDDERAVLELLRARNIDVVLGHENHESDAFTDADQAKRLARADVDGALLFPSFRGAVATALHLANTPLLWLDDGRSGAVYDVLTQLNAPVNRLVASVSQPDEAADAIERWLSENNKIERQRGQEVALKLYGQALGYRGDAAALLPDPARWLTQFGLSLVFLGPGDAPHDEAPAPDFAGDADALGGIHAILTRQLLRLVSGADDENSVTTNPIVAFTFGDATSEPATFAAIGRTGERFRCVLARGFMDETSAPRFVPALQSHATGALSGGFDLRWLCGVRGEHVGALRAACRALDIEAFVLR